MASEALILPVTGSRPRTVVRPQFPPRSFLTQVIEAAEMVEESAGSGVQLVSDGSSENTQLLVDGHPVRGVTEITWRFSRRQRRATMIVEMHDVTVDGTVEVPSEVLAALRTIQDYELKHL